MMITMPRWLARTLLYLIVVLTIINITGFLALLTGPLALAFPAWVFVMMKRRAARQ